MAAPGIAPHATATPRLSRMAADVLLVARAVLGLLAGRGWNPRRDRLLAPLGALVDCVWCGSDFVCPIYWEPADDAHWSIRLRCGACEVWRDVVVPDEEAHKLERALAVQGTAIERAAARLDRERMVIELDTFVAALECDVIDPSWFVR
jgi:hypothetical protein